MKKKKLQTIKSLEKKLDHLVSRYVIKRDKRCVICWSTQKLGCGHLFSRRHKSTRWDLLNCNCQCWSCNYKHVHDTYAYTHWFINKYGKFMWDSLYLEHSTIKKWKRDELLKLKEELLQLLKI